MDDLIGYLESSDFFRAPASTRFHAAYEGGLAQHSLNVFRLFGEKVKTYGLEVPADSIAICGLLHDLCKTNTYVRGKRNVKQDGKWIEKEEWLYQEALPFGHGEKSVYLLQNHIRLTEQEAMTIRWHMGFSEPKENWRKLDEARDKYPCIIAFYVADIEASFLCELRGEG